MYLFRLIYLYLEENYFSASLNGQYENIEYVETATTLLMLVGGLALGIFIASCIIVFQKRVVGRFIRRLLALGAKDKESARSLAELGLDKSGFIKHELSRSSVSRKLVSVVNTDGSVTDYAAELAAAFPEFAAEILAEQGGEEVTHSTDGKEDTPDIEDADECPARSAASLLPEADRAEGAKEKKSAGDRAKDFFFEKKFRPRPIDLTTAKFFIPEALRLRAEFRFREKGSSPWLLVLAFFLCVALLFLGLRFIPLLVKMLDATVGNFRGL